MKNYNNLSASLQLITATRLSFKKNSLRVIARTLAIGLFASLASQIRAETTTQTIQVAPDTPTVTIIVTSTAPVTVTATTAQPTQYNVTAQPAQYNTSASVQNIPVPDNVRETSLAFPKARGVNMFFMLEPTYVDSHNSEGKVHLYGLTLAFGWRTGIHGKFQIDSSLLFGSHDESRVYTGVHYDPRYGYYTTIDRYHGHVDYVVGLDAFTYSFIIPFDKKGVFEMRLSPSVGVAYIYTNYKGSETVGSFTPPPGMGNTTIGGYTSNTAATDGQFALAGGGGVGFTLHTSKRFMLDLGCRYMSIGTTTYNWGKIPRQDTFAYTLMTGWKF